jgi:RHS repeat-associated protein
MKGLVIFVIILVISIHLVSAKEVANIRIFDVLTASESGGEVYFYAGANLVASSSNGDDLEYKYQDRLGSDINSKSLPFGQPIEVGDRFSFTGKELDSELYYYYARYYDSELGRFTSVDPVSSEPAYQYVGNNPLNMVDPSGMFEVPSFTDSQIETINFNVEQSRNTQDNIIEGLQGGPIIFEGLEDPNLVDFRLPENGIFRDQMEGLKNIGPDQYIEMRSRLGVKGDTDPNVDNPTIVRFFQEVGASYYADDENDWCAACLSDTLKSSGKIYPTGLEAIRALNYAGLGTNPPEVAYGVGVARGQEKVGDIMVFNSHVGYFAGRFSNGDVLLLGGNQGNEVTFNREQRSVIDIRRPLTSEQKNIVSWLSGVNF